MNLKFSFYFCKNLVNCMIFSLDMTGRSVWGHYVPVLQAGELTPLQASLRADPNPIPKPGPQDRISQHFWFNDKRLQFCSKGFCGKMSYFVILC